MVFDRERFTTEGGAWLFNIGIVLFILILVTWGGLFLFKGSLKTNAANWREQIIALENELRPDLLNQLIQLSNRISAARELLSGHVFTSNVFTMLERDTHPQVALTSFQYVGDARKVELNAKAASYRVVAEQVTILEADPQVESVAFGGLQLDEKGLVVFRLTIISKPSLLRLRVP